MEYMENLLRLLHEIENALIQNDKDKAEKLTSDAIALVQSWTRDG